VRLLLRMLRVLLLLQQQRCFHEVMLIKLHAAAVAIAAVPIAARCQSVAQ
jgi:hypothetical protein